MSKENSGRAIKGSQYWTQVIVNEKPEILKNKINEAISRKDDIEWRSPLESENFAEYSDNQFLLKLDLKPDVINLKEFWPKGGPHWDALGVSKSEPKSRYLVEAKSHIQEMLSPPSKASEPSLEIIKNSLGDTKTFCKANEDVFWYRRCYQYFNRLAHLKFLRVNKSVDAYMVFLYFVNDDTIEKTSFQKWKGALEFFKSYTGLNESPLANFVVDVFIDIDEIRRK